jgi:hypothetical protein
VARESHAIRRHARASRAGARVDARRRAHRNASDVWRRHMRARGGGSREG